MEAIFAEHGYEIVFPEKLTLAEQVRIFDGAKVTAGYGSSAMLNLVYASSPGTRIMISSESYIALNEYLLGAVRGRRHALLLVPRRTLRNRRTASRWKAVLLRLRGSTPRAG